MTAILLSCMFFCCCQLMMVKGNMLIPPLAQEQISSPEELLLRFPARHIRVPQRLARNIGVTDAESEVAPDPPSRTATTEPTYTGTVFTPSTSDTSCEICNNNCDSPTTCEHCVCNSVIKNQRSGEIGKRNSWLVSIQVRGPINGSYEHICSGSLISDRLVLTAPSCLYHGHDHGVIPETAYKRLPRDLSVEVALNGSNAHRIFVEDMDISSSASNLRSYVTAAKLVDDVAIIVLQESTKNIPEQFKKRVASISVPSEGAEVSVNCRFYWCFLALWVNPTDEKRFGNAWSVHNASVVPQRGGLDVVGQDECKRGWGTENNHVESMTHLVCTNGTIDSYQGNVGGPLVETYYDHGSRKLNTRIVGINIGQNKKKYAPKESALNAFIRVDKPFAEWINRIVKRFK